MTASHAWAADAHRCALLRLLDRQLADLPDDPEARQAVMLLALLATARHPARR